MKTFISKIHLNQSFVFNSLYVLFGLQLLLIFLYFITWSISSENPLVVYDQMTYYQDAVDFFHNKANLYTSTRPIFSWFSIILLKTIDAKLSYQLLSSLNTIFYCVILVASTIWICRSLKCYPLTMIGILSTIFAMPLFYGRSTALMGDVAVAAWVFLFAAGLVSLQTPKFHYWKIIFLGLVSAFGLLTKPIFFMYPVAAITSLTVISIIKGRLKKVSWVFVFKKISIDALLLITTILIVGKLIIPTQLLELIKGYFYNNEVLGYWQSQEGIFNTWLWFPTIAFQEISIIPALILFLTFLYPIAIVCKEIVQIRKLNDLQKLSANCISQLAFFSFSFSVLAFLIIVAYISLRVVTKEAGSTLFTLPLFILSGFYILDTIAKQSQIKFKVYLILVGIILIANLSNTISWSPKLEKLTPRVVNNYFSLPEQALRKQYPTSNFQNRISYEQIGVFRIIDFLKEDCKNFCKNQKAEVFVPHGNPYSFSVFQSASYTDHDIVKLTPNVETPLVFSSQNLNYGGWGDEGGIPKEFFNAQYIVHVVNHDQGDLSGNIEVYNKTISRELSAKNPAFMDGLEPVFKFNNPLGDTLIVYKRNHLPSPENYAIIVENLTHKDLNNLWNIPFLYTSFVINPNSDMLKKQLDVMSEHDFLESVKYEYGDPEQKALVDLVLNNYRQNKPLPNIRYPQILQSSFTSL